MNLLANSLGLSTIVFGFLVWLPVLMWSIFKAPWHKVKGDSSAQNIFFAITVVMMLIWKFGASLGDGITFHFLLMTLAVLMFGFQFAVVAGSIALIFLTFFSGLGMLSLGVNGFLLVLVPALITALMVKISEKYLDQNFFVYVFFNGFLAGGLAVVASLSLGGWFMWINESLPEKVLLENFFPFIPLMATPEGFVNGMLIAAIVLLRPEWVASFHDDTHLKGK